MYIDKGTEDRKQTQQEQQQQQQSINYKGLFSLLNCIAWDCSVDGRPEGQNFYNVQQTTNNIDSRELERQEKKINIKK
jgi:hypothetical protein